MSAVLQPPKGNIVRQLPPPPPTTITARVERITPDIARQMLNHNALNRKIKRHTLAKYTRAMQSGNFDSMNGEGIIVNRDGGLENGQHRLNALIASELPFMDFLVVRGVAPRANETMDQGTPRTSGDTAVMRQYEDAHVLMAAVRWLWVYNTNWPGGLVDWRGLSNQELIEYLDKNAHVAYANIEVRKAYPRSCSLLMKSVATFIRVVTDALDPQLSNEFFNALETGQVNDSNRQVLLLRDRLLARGGRGSQLSSVDIVILAARAWNAMRQRRELKHLVIGRGPGTDRASQYRNAPRFE